MQMIKAAIQAKLKEAGCQELASSLGGSSSDPSLEPGSFRHNQPSGSHGEVNPSIATTLSHSSHTSQKDLSSEVSPMII